MLLSATVLKYWNLFELFEIQCVLLHFPLLPSLRSSGERQREAFHNVYNDFQFILQTRMRRTQCENMRYDAIQAHLPSPVAHFTLKHVKLYVKFGGLSSASCRAQGN